MLAWEQVQQLEDFDTGGARVLSLYLDTDPTRQVQRSYLTLFEDMLKEAHEQLEKPARRELLQEAAQVQTWLEQQPPQGKGLAVFSCAPRGLWQTHFLPVRVRDLLVFEPKPDVAALVEFLDECERYAVALVDKPHARLFTVFAGEIEEIRAFEDLVPPKQARAGFNEANLQRHHETHVLWHLKRVVSNLADLVRRREFDRLILAGPEEPVSELRRMLPHALARRLVAVIPAEMAASDAEILAKTLEVERHIEAEAEQRLLNEVIDMARTGGRATIGIAPTLTAIWVGDVQTLLVADDVHGNGSECPNCGRLEPGTVATCPNCGAAMQPLHDLFHRVMGRTLDQSGRVEVVHGDARERLLADGGGLGAMLRYRWPGELPLGTEQSASAGAGQSAGQSAEQGASRGAGQGAGRGAGRTAQGT